MIKAISPGGEVSTDPDTRSILLLGITKDRKIHSVIVEFDDPEQIESGEAYDVGREELKKLANGEDCEDILDVEGGGVTEYLDSNGDAADDLLPAFDEIRKQYPQYCFD